MPFYRVPFRIFPDRFRIYGYGFENFFAFSEFMGKIFCKNSSIGELFGLIGMILRKFFRIYGHTFGKFRRIYGWYFYDLNGTTPYLGNSSDPLKLWGTLNWETKRWSLYDSTFSHSKRESGSKDILINLIDSSNVLNSGRISNAI